jgi:hypothetical protein
MVRMEENASFETRVEIYKKGLKGGGNPDSYDDDQWGDVKDYLKLQENLGVVDTPQGSDQMVFIFGSDDEDDMLDADAPEDQGAWTSDTSTD